MVAGGNRVVERRVQRDWRIIWDHYRSKRVSGTFTMGGMTVLEVETYSWIFSFMLRITW